MGARRAGDHTSDHLAAACAVPSTATLSTTEKGIDVNDKPCNRYFIGEAEARLANALASMLNDGKHGEIDLKVKIQDGLIRRLFVTTTEEVA